MDDRTTAIIKNLITKTNERQVLWQDGTLGRRYRQDGSCYSLTLPRARAEVTFSSPDRDEDTVWVSIYNANNDCILSLRCTPSDADYDLLRQLYDAARNSYLRIDETLDHIESELKGAKPIGEAKPQSRPPADLDPIGGDIPF